MSDFIDESPTVPVITGRRISVIDVMAALESPEPESQLYDSWNLSEEQVEAAKTYITEHEEELQKLEEEMREAGIETTYWDKCAWLCPDCDGHLELVQSGDHSIEPGEQYTDDDERTEAWFAAKDTFPGVKCYECERLYVAEFREVSPEELRERLDEE